MKKKDSLIHSLLRGRLGAALLSVGVAFAAIYGIDVTPEMKDAVIAGASALAGLLAAISKVRE